MTPVAGVLRGFPGAAPRFRLGRLPFVQGHPPPDMEGDASS